MRIARRRRALTAGTGLIAAAALISALAVATTGATSALAAARQAASAGQAGPVIKLIAAEHKVTAYKFGKQPVYIDPGIWIASFHSAFQLNVGRPSYIKPVTVTQVIRTRHGVVRRSLPHWILGGWNGLRHFARIVVRNSSGRVVARRNLTFCPGGGELAKANPDGAQTSSVPDAVHRI